MEELFTKRPQVDVQLDQSHCTAETSVRRAILCLKERALIGKRILCVGDDNLVNVTIGMLLKKLFPRKLSFSTRIDVVDVDQRFLHFIQEIAEKRRITHSLYPP
ncbi:bis-aminopropyl spermidine synthase family protein [Litoribacterium kuwaitense]|uniref:bis-aminopropyl spermidine synthase family protein n=1 Tax=Litoribacterium kuwaitense TaxID=1398745 RepID=UPI0035E415DB